MIQSVKVQDLPDDDGCGIQTLLPFVTDDQRPAFRKFVNAWIDHADYEFDPSFVWRVGGSWQQKQRWCGFGRANQYGSPYLYLQRLLQIVFDDRSGREATDSDCPRIMMYCCRNGHTWYDQGDAEKCCNPEWQRILLIGKDAVHKSETSLVVEETTGVPYGRQWQRVTEANQ